MHEPRSRAHASRKIPRGDAYLSRHSVGDRATAPIPPAEQRARALQRPRVPVSCEARTVPSVLVGAGLTRASASVALCPAQSSDGRDRRSRWAYLSWMRTWINPAPGWVGSISGDRDAIQFHARLAGYTPTPLLECRTIASRCGVARVLVKYESERFGLRSFKILGASWAAYSQLRSAIGCEPDAFDREALRSWAQRGPWRRLIAATDGNYGLAVARVAHWLGLDARIFVPHRILRARLLRIASAGASVTLIAGTYDDALAACGASAEPGDLFLSDTGCTAGDTVAALVSDGYVTAFAELEAKLGGVPADAIFVP